MSERQEVFTIHELVILTHVCPKCGNAISFNVATEEAYGLPKRCSVFDEPMGAAALAFQAYRKFYQAATAGGLKMKLQTKPAAGVE